MTNNFRIIEMEETLLAVGYGNKEDAFKKIRKFEKMNWGLSNEELSDIEDLCPIYEFTTIERNHEDDWHTWKEEPFKVEKHYGDYLFDKPIGYVVYY